MLRGAGTLASIHLARLEAVDDVVVAAPHSPLAAPTLLAELEAIAARLHRIDPRYTPLHPMDPASSAYTLLAELRHAREIEAFIDAAPHHTLAALAALLATASRGARVTLTLSTRLDEKPYTRTTLDPILAALQGLPKTLHATILALSEARQATAAELAARLGLSESTVEKRLKRLKKLGMVSKRGKRYTLTPWGAYYIEATTR